MDSFVSSGQKERPVVIGIMGHIDHGKTTFIDTFFQQNIQEKEKGGITQTVNIWSSKKGGRNFYLFDTPGHNSFIRLRKRGISLIDIVILVIDINEGVMSQTEEIINYIKEFSLPFVVFLNVKKEEQKNEGNLNKVLNQLQNFGIVSLDWGGETIVEVGSAKNPIDVDNVVENSLLVVQPSKVDVNSEIVSGVAIDSFFCSRTKFTVNKLLVQNGTLKNNSFLFLGGKIGQIKVLKNLNGEKVSKIEAGEVALVFGCDFFSELGDRFIVIEKEDFDCFNEILKKNTYDLNKPSRVFEFSDIFDNQKKNVNIFLISDSENSLQTLQNVIRETNSEHVSFFISGFCLGKTNFSDLELIKITDSIVLSFKFSLKNESIIFFKENKIIFFQNDVIYKLIENLKEIIELKRSKVFVDTEKKVGEASIEVVYKFSRGNIAGCRVRQGIVDRNCQVKLFRKNVEIFFGKIKSLQVEKKDVNQARSGQDCGIILEKFDDFNVNDVLFFFQIEKKEIK